MDIFCEYLVEKKSTKDKLIKHGLTLACIVFMLVVFYFCFFVKIKFIALIPILWGGAIFGTVILRRNFALEYEYIFTNGDLDIDKITAKSSRKRMVSIKCSKVEKYGEYKGQTAPGSVKQTYNFCNPDSEGQMYMIAESRGEGTVMIIFAPDERIREAIEKHIPRTAR